MEFRQLRYFVYVAEHGSISHAARLLHVAQPALTKQIHNLEDELKVPLFERSSRGVALTRAGEQFLSDAKKLIGDLGSAKKRAQMAGQGQIGTLSVGITVAHCWLPVISNIFKTFRGLCPDVSVSLNPQLSIQQLDMIRSYELDAGFLFQRPMNEDYFDSLLVYEESFVLAVHKDSPLQKKRPQRLIDLADEDFVWFPRSVAPFYHDSLIYAFQKAGFTPKVVQEGRDSIMVLSLVAAGLGCSIVPAAVQARGPSNVLTFPLKDLDLTIPLEFVWRRNDDSPVLHRFIEASKEVANKQLR